MENGKTRDAVAIVGVGAVGATTAYALMNAGATSELILIGRDRDRVNGEVMDLNHGSSFVPPVRIRAGGHEDCGEARAWSSSPQESGRSRARAAWTSLKETWRSLTRSYRALSLTMTTASS